MPRPGRYWPDTRHDALPRPVHWDREAVCRDLDPGVFFPEGEGGGTALVIEEAKAYCRTCPVMHQCQRDALERGEAFGVWGGLDEEDRKALLRLSAKHPVTAAAAEDSSDARAPAS